MPSWVLAVPLTFVAGLPAAYLLTRRLPLAILVAPLAGAVLAAAATVLMLIVGGPLWCWLAVALSAQIVAWPLLRSRPAVAVAHGSWADVGWYAIPLLPPLLSVVAPPNGWDAHAIWWLHAAYFAQGGAYARASMGNPALAFTHTDYPPLMSSAVAGVWQALPGYGLYVAQFVSTTVTFAAIAALAYAVRVVTDRAPALVSRLAGVLAGWSAWSVADARPTSGYADTLWTAALVAAVVLLLLGRDPWRRPALPVLLLTVAMLAKNEGLVAGLMVIALVVLRERRDPRRTVALLVPLAAGFGWLVLSRSLGARSDLADGHTADLLSGGTWLLARLPAILSAVYRNAGVITAIALAVAILGGLFLRRGRRDLGLGSDLWLWLVGAVYAASLTFTYLVTPYNLKWHLATSVDRVTLPLTVLGTVSAVCWAVVAIGARRPADRQVPGGEVPVPDAKGSGV